MKSIRIVVALILSLLVYVSMVAASSPASDGKTYPLNLSGELLLFESYGDSNLIVAGETAMLFNETEYLNFSVPAYSFAARLHGDSLFILSAMGAQSKLSEFDLNSGNEISSYVLEIGIGEIDRADIDFSGRCYLRKMFSSDILQFTEENPTGTSVCGGSSFFAVNGDELVAWNGGLDFYSLNDELPEFIYRIESAYEPALMSLSGYFVDINGVLCSYSSSVQFVYDSSTAFPAEKPASFCFSEEGMLCYININGTPVKLDPYNTDSPIMYFAEDSYAVNGNGILTLNAGKYSFMPYSSFLVHVEPEEGGGESGFPDSWNVQGEYIIFEKPKTISALLSEYSCEIKLDGSSVISGFIKTEMELVTPEGESYYLVLLGDVNGSGTVNSTDRGLILKALVGSGNLSDAKSLAADIDGDGRIGISDSVLISGLWA